LALGVFIYASMRGGKGFVWVWRGTVGGGGRFSSQAQSKQLCLLAQLPGQRGPARAATAEAAPRPGGGGCELEWRIAGTNQPIRGRLNDHRGVLATTMLLRAAK
jgi:hypothetical protein